jgi:hypothetical protein
MGQSLAVKSAIISRGMNEIIFLIENAVEGGYTARALGESIFTEGDDLDNLRVNIRDAVDCHFEPEEKPKMIRLHFVSEEVIAA